MSWKERIAMVAGGVLVAIVLLVLARWVFGGGTWWSRSSTAIKLPDELAERVYDNDPDKRFGVISHARSSARPRDTDKDVYLACAVLLGDGVKKNSDAAEESLVAAGEYAVDPLIAVLDSDSQQTRDRAIGCLARIGRPAIEPLKKALNERNRLKLTGIEEALVAIGLPARPALQDAIGSKDVRVSMAASETLALMERRQREAVERVAAAVRARAAAEARARAAAEAAAEARAKAEADAKAKADAEAAIREKAAAEAKSKADRLAGLEARAKDPSPVVRADAMKEFGEKKDPDTFNLVVSALGDRCTQVQEEAQKAATAIGSPIVEDLIKAFNIPEARIMARDTLVLIREPSVGPLIEELGGDNALNVDRALWSLVLIGEPAKPALERAASAERGKLSFQARRTLATIAAQEQKEEEKKNPPKPVPPQEPQKIDVRVQLDPIVIKTELKHEPLEIRVQTPKTRVWDGYKCQWIEQ